MAPYLKRFLTDNPGDASQIVTGLPGKSLGGSTLIFLGKISGPTQWLD
jgi:hypothetical protein